MVPARTTVPRQRTPGRVLVAALALAALLPACPDGGASPDVMGRDIGAWADASEPVPDFRLQDVNAASATYRQLVSPRDFLGRWSAWYFGHAT